MLGVLSTVTEDKSLDIAREGTGHVLAIAHLIPQVLLYGLASPSGVSPAISFEAPPMVSS